MGIKPERPAQLFFRVTAPQFQTLTMHIYNRTDPAIGRDALFSVKPALLDDFRLIETENGLTLTLEYAFANGSWHGALVALTGCRVGRVSDDRPTADLDGLPVYLTGGDADPWIPVTAFAGATSALGTTRARLRADMFPGRGHEASLPEMALNNAILAELAAGKSVTLERAP